ncbi:MAG: class I SAM-dependent methyltransferase [Clostridia bacterium]
MIGNPVDYDKKFKSDFPIFPAKFDSELKRYLNLVPGKEVLDLRIGQGRNSIPLSELDFKVTGVDYSTKCLEICKNSCSKLNLIQSDIRKLT